MELEFPFNINYTVLKNSIQQTISQTCNFKIGKVPGKIKERKNISCKYASTDGVLSTKSREIIFCSFRGVAPTNCF